ncbi:MAG TPA: TetR family transcriptional regulator, partial [Gemmatirosa sp.]
MAGPQAGAPGPVAGPVGDRADAPTTTSDVPAAHGAATGRPRDPAATAAILEAALALLAEGGYRAMTTDALAARARTSKA